jgi:aminotransferase in exopolysaccharide biosynthesis
MFKKIISFIREVFGQESGPIPLHEPVFVGKEKDYVLDCINSTFVSSVGKYVDEFEQKVSEYTGSKYAVATVNGTAALHVALLLAGVKPGDEVLTQAISFVATANAISYCGANPVFLDSERFSLGLSPNALERFLKIHCVLKDDGFTYNKTSGKKIVACVPVHVFGHPVQIDRIKMLCEIYNIALVEDAAESIGSYFNGKHTGTFGNLGILSFNGNKAITTGGGGIIITNDEKMGRKAKHLTTTAKVDHPWEYVHDNIGFNYRLPNINAALGCAQMETLPNILEKKRRLAKSYQNFFDSIKIQFIVEDDKCCSNYWLNAIILKNLQERNEFLKYSNYNKVMTRPLWRLIPKLTMYSHCQTDGLTSSRWLEERVVNIPSSIKI